MKSFSRNVGGATYELSPSDLLRVCRDLAWSEIAAMPGILSRLGPRLRYLQTNDMLDWSLDGLALDSLACMQLATAAAVWCNSCDTGFGDLYLEKCNVQGWAETMHVARSSGTTDTTFSTSGSTGKRQHISHSYDALVDEARCWAQVLHADATPVNRIVTLVPCHHIYGFIWGVLLPKLLGVPVLETSHEAMTEFQAGDLVVGVPDQWQWMAGSARLGTVPMQGVTSTAPMPDLLHQRLVFAERTSQPLLTRLLQIYGSTQTGGVGWRDNPDTPYNLAPGRRRSANGGIELLLSEGSLVPLAIQDELRWSTMDQFELLRRIDSCVQIAGHNVSTNWVREQLLAYPAVNDASVRLDSASPIPRLKAFVVLKAPADQSQKTGLQAWALHMLPWYAALGSICYGTELPLNIMGKPSDWPVNNSDSL